MRDEYKAITRFADLDTQRHITSRTYESFALEGRYRVLAQAGLPFETIKNEQISLVTVSGYCKFHRQQFPGAELKVVTHASPTPPPSAPPLPLLKEREGRLGGVGEVHWDQKILDASGELVAHLQQLTRTVRGVTLRQAQGDKTTPPPHEPETDSLVTLSLSMGDEVPTEPILYEDLKPWSGHNQRVVSQYQIPYADRDFAGKYNAAALWKIFEEGRWMFVEKIGLTYERIVELDTTSFYMGSIYNFFAEVPAGRTLEVVTWIERIDKIRYYFRQDVLHNGKLLLTMRDEQLIVSLSKARPQRASEKFLGYIGKYVEFPN
jgi:acyl-CoA thioesterase FadM